MTSVAEIAKEAFDDVAEEMPEVIQSASLTRTTQGAYDPATGQYATETQTFFGRAFIADEKAMADSFPAYVAGPADRIAYVEGLAVTPVKTDAMTIGGRPMSVCAVGDIVGVGQFFGLIVRGAA